jgi:hypothetical protein
LATELARLLETYPAGNATAAAARSLRTTGDAQADSAAFSVLVTSSMELVSQYQFNTAAAVEAARLAALGHDGSFFRSGEAINAVSAAAAHDSMAARARAEFVRLQAGARSSSVDWPDVAARLTALLQTLVE